MIDMEPIITPLMPQICFALGNFIGMAVTGSFRIRLVIAMVLLLSFVICDIRQVSYEGENAETVFNRIVEDTDLSGVLDGMALPQAEF